jgi:hypothetical protein
MNTKFTVQLDEDWPFVIRIMDGTRVVAAFSRICHSTTQYTIADCRAAVGFEAGARELVAQQEREIVMLAAAPDLYEAGAALSLAMTACDEARSEYRAFMRLHPENTGPDLDAVYDKFCAARSTRNRADEAMAAALRKARGESQ